jgi:hypothetical protein
MVFRAGETVPDIHERKVLFIRAAEISQLDNEIHLLCFHILYKGFQACFSIMHNILVYIRANAKPDLRFTVRWHSCQLIERCKRKASQCNTLQEVPPVLMLHTNK